MGYRTDGDAGLMHPRQRHAGTGSGARYYDAQVGRFITRDTVLSENPYLYCEHDPVNAVDPSGHVAFALAPAAPMFVVSGPPGWVVGGAVLVGAAIIGGIYWYKHRPPPSVGGGDRPWDNPRPHVTPDPTRGPVYL